MKRAVICVSHQVEQGACLIATDTGVNYVRHV